MRTIYLNEDSYYIKKITEKLLTGMLALNTSKQTKHTYIFFYINVINFLGVPPPPPHFNPTVDLISILHAAEPK